MKKFLRLFLALGLGLALAVSTHAESKQVTGLTTGTPAVILIPGTKATVITIANVGANAINFTYDGGSAFGGTDPTTGATGRGQPLAAGQTISLNGSLLTGVRIVAIMQAATTTINIQTNAPVNNSAFPTN